MRKKEPLASEVSISEQKGSSLLLPEPLNLDFEDGEHGSMSGAHHPPIGWMASGSHPDSYKMCVDGTTRFAGGKCVLIESRRDPQSGFGTLMQIWFSKVALEPASDDVEVTDNKADIQARKQPVNMCFEE